MLPAGFLSDCSLHAEHHLIELNTSYITETQNYIKCKFSTCKTKWVLFRFYWSRLISYHCILYITHHTGSYAFLILVPILHKKLVSKIHNFSADLSQMSEQQWSTVCLHCSIYRICLEQLSESISKDQCRKYGKRDTLKDWKPKYGNLHRSAGF